MFRRLFVPFCLTLALALGASIASAQGQSGQHPPANGNGNGNGGVATQGCGSTQGGTTGCKAAPAPRLVTLADIRTVLDLLGAILP
jgi:hypothetical protein